MTPLDNKTGQKSRAGSIRAARPTQDYATFFRLPKTFSAICKDGKEWFILHRNFSLGSRKSRRVANTIVVAGADSVLRSLRFPEGTFRTMRQGCGAVHDVPLRRIADSTKRSLRQPHFRQISWTGAPIMTGLEKQVCATTLEGSWKVQGESGAARIERGRISSEGGGSNPSPVPRRLEEAPSRDTLSPPAVPVVHWRIWK